MQSKEALCQEIRRLITDLEARVANQGAEHGIAAEGDMLALQGVQEGHRWLHKPAVAEVETVSGVQRAGVSEVTIEAQRASAANYKPGPRQAQLATRYVVRDYEGDDMCSEVFLEGSNPPDAPFDTFSGGDHKQRARDYAAYLNGD